MNPETRSRRPPLRLFLLLLAAMLFAACGQDVGDPTPPPLPTACSGTPAATYDWAQSCVFDVRCINCHAGPFASQGLRLDAANAPSIVDAPSTEQPALNLIAPGDPANSYLIRKVEGAPSISGAQMPFDGTAPLPAGHIQALRDWVTAGAPIP